jgi:glycine betaine/proline transport system permease protein
LNTNPAADRVDALVDTFVGPGAGYYRARLARMGQASGFRLSFNPFAALGGPIWFAARGLWNWFLPFLLVEAFGWVQVIIGLVGDRGREQHERAQSILRTLKGRREQLQEAVSSGSASVEALQRAVASLERALADASAQAAHATQSGLALVLFGAAVVIGARLAQAALANGALERRFEQWRSDRRVASGRSWRRALAGVALLLLVVGLTGARFARPELLPWLNEFPTRRSMRVDTGDWIKGWFEWAKRAGEGVFGSITLGVRRLLDGLETLFVGTPWLVIALVVALLAWLSGGARVAIFAVAALAYLGFLGFWEKAMTTISLLGAAALVSIALGIPLGIVCARKPRLFAVVRPVLDFMQSMPSFVYLIPVVAFFGAGKPAAIVATLIFGSPPVVRMTVLGLQQVPPAVREAAVAFGATPLYLLMKVDLPLASRTIMAGVNQTILLSLAMVVVASLIGAKGLGEDVLEALQYASEGQGILAGLAILFCALLLDRIVQGRRDKR